MVLATSDRRQVAENFMVLAAARGETPVVWTIKVDPRGAAQQLYRCKHMHQVPKSNVPYEFRFLRCNDRERDAAARGRCAHARLPHSNRDYCSAR